MSIIQCSDDKSVSYSVALEAITSELANIIIIENMRDSYNKIIARGLTTATIDISGKLINYKVDSVSYNEDFTFKRYLISTSIDNN